MVDGEGTLAMVAKVVAAYVSNNPVPVAELPGLVRSVHGTLSSLLGSSPTDAVTTQKPAVPVKKSVTAEHIVPVGVISPDHVVTPAPLVDYLITNG